MRKLLTMMIALLVALTLVACGAQEAAQPSAQVTERPDWGFEENTKTLYVDVDMGAFEPDAPDFEGTTSNVPWAEYLPQIENIVVGDDVTFIGDYTFAFCPNLKNVEVGKNVKALDFRCFFKCGDWDNDSKLEFHFNSRPSFGEDVFGYTWDNPNVAIFVPDDMKEFWANYTMQKGEMYIDGYAYEETAMPGNIEDVVNAMLVNPMQLYLGDIGEISKNEGGHIGNISSENRCDDERMEVFAGDDGTAGIPFETRLRDYGSDNQPQQAVLVKFQPERLDYLRFDLIGMGEYSIAFEDSEWWFVDVQNFSKTSFGEFGLNNFKLDGFTRYNVLLATDADMNLRVMIWADGDYQNQAYFETSLYQGRDDIFESNWKMNIGFGYSEPFGQLNIYEYAVYTFESFTEKMPYYAVDNGGQGQDGMDYGPSWSINIAGNFNIISDMVWQSVQLQDIEAGTDIYAGYNLAEMMNFSGNGSDKAFITFGQEDVENVVIQNTNNACIVFMKNGEFLGGPYLLEGNKLYEFAVIEINPN